MEGATVIQGDERVILAAGGVTVIFPINSRARTYQATLEESGDCGDGALACAALTLYTAEGETERDARLIFPAEIIISVSPEQVDALGGPGVVLQAYALGGILFRVNDAVRDWNNLLFEFDVRTDGSFAAESETSAIRPIPYIIGLDVDNGTRERAMWQIRGTTPTPSPASLARSTPQPTATPTPLPVPVEIPNTGDSSTPLSLVLALAAAAIALSLIVAIALMDRHRH